MPIFEFESVMPVDSWVLFRYHDRPGAFERLAPPWERLEIVSREGGITDGGSLHFRIRKGPFHINWHARHGNNLGADSFVDFQEKGPFKSWRHQHNFVPLGADNSKLVDRLEIEFPLGPLGGLLMGAHLRAQLNRMFHFRHKRTYLDLERSRLYLDRQPLRLVFVGKLTPILKNLASFLSVLGHDVFAMFEQDRAQGAYAVQSLFGDKLPHPLAYADVIIHSGKPYLSRKAAVTPENRYAYLGALADMLAVCKRPKRLIHIAPASRSLDHLVENPSLDWVDREARRKDYEALQQGLDRLRHFVSAEISLYHGNVITPSMSQLANVLLRLESFLFLRDGARSPEFAWISQEDVIGAIHHILYQEDLEGELALIAPTRATRAELQEIMIKRSFLAYTGQRILKVIPWASPGLPPGMDGQLLEMKQITETGYQFLAPDLRRSFELEFGLIRG